MTTDLQIRPTDGKVSHPDADELHVVCDCTPDKSFCGMARKSNRIVPMDEGSTNCVVCNEMIFGPCPYCGSNS